MLMQTDTELSGYNTAMLIDERQQAICYSMNTKGDKRIYEIRKVDVLDCIFSAIE